ncbi:MAG: hypothetical protein ACYSOZ_05845, partial [Planctomycetota bacterium]
MKKKLMMLLMAAVLVTAVQADVYIVARSDNPGPAATADMQAFLTANFSAQDLGTVYADNYENGAPSATANDLVIFLRETKSNYYIDNAGELTSWNDLAAPILMMSPYASENDKFGWSTDPDTVTAASTGDETEVLLPADDLFVGVTVTSGYANLMVNDFGSLPASAFSYTGTTVLGDSSNNLVLARIAAGTDWSSTSLGGLSGTHNSNRIVFFQSSAATGIDEDLTADGKVVLRNAISELLNATPAPALPWTDGFESGSFGPGGWT